jgi:copper chaperone
MRYNFKIDGMSCEHCVNAVKQALEMFPNVRIKSVTLGKATIESDTLLDKKLLGQAITEAGFSLMDD